MSNYTSLIASLRAARLRWGLEVDDLAKLLGVHPRTIFKYESNELIPSAKRLIKWADVLAHDIKIEMRK